MQVRDANALAVTALSHYPIITILGPRQAGKTTLAKALDGRPYANLESPETRQFASEDPKGFLAGFPHGAVLDEIQRVPELLSWLQVDVDQRQQTGRWILTGSHQPQLRGAVAQSLAGRTALIHLLPWSLGELAASGVRMDVSAVMLAGGFPRLHVAGIPPARFHADYLATYVERDVRQLAALRDLDAFQRYAALLAGRIGSAVNWSSLGADAGVSEVTAKAWSGLLEASFVAAALRPWSANLGKRLVKHPKLYFHDTGMAAHLIGCTDVTHLTTHPLRGGLFENLIISETRKCIAHWGASARLHFFGTSTHEVDLLIEAGGRCLAVEIKSGRTIANDWCSGLSAAAGIPSLGVDGRVVVYGGDEEQRRTDVTICPWWRFPVILGQWLVEHRAATHVPDLKDLSARLQSSFSSSPV